MLELSTLHHMPFHLQRILTDRIYTPIEVVNALVYYVAMECGFVSDRVDTSSYNFTWFYSFDKRIFEDCQCEHFSNKMTLKFVMNQKYKYTLECLELDGLALVVAHEVSDASVAKCESVALPISRYIPFKKLINTTPSSFRNLKELSHLLKHELFHQLRNEIYRRSQNTAPCLNSMPEMIKIKILRYLDAKSKNNLSRTCKTQYVNLLNFKKLRN